MEMKFEEYFHFKSTKHWLFDLHLIEYRVFIEIAGGPWSGGRKGKLATKAWSMDRYDHAEELGYRFQCAAASGVRDEGMAPRYRLAGAGSKPP